MLVWILVIAVTVLCCAALFYAGRRAAVNAGDGHGDAAEQAHHQNLLAEIETSEAEGRLSKDDGRAARAELARDIIRQREQATAGNKIVHVFNAPLVAAAVILIGGLGVGLYAILGSPDQPGAPLSGRATEIAATAQIADAVSKVEARLAKSPDDVRGWKVLAPVYMRSGRYADAEKAFRRILALAPPTADAETDLAEAIILANNGIATDESLSLLQSAAASDPNHVRSRFYLAGEATRVGDFAKAITLWKDVIAQSKGNEPWRAAADQGLAVATAGLAGSDGATGANGAVGSSAMIASMVDGLSTRLASQGGTIEEWTRLVRSRMVLGQKDKAQAAYNAAKSAYPDPSARADLDALAKNSGLE